MNANHSSAVYDSDRYQPVLSLESHEGEVVLDLKERRLCVRKTIQIFNLQAYQWLSTHTHPNVAAVYQYELIPGSGLVVLEEFVEGTTLDRYLAEKQPSDEEKEKLFLQVLDAIAFLHSAKPPVIHRDIKSSNIIVTPQGSAKLIDFDAAKSLNLEESRDTVLIGTPGVAAPEQYGFGPSDQRTDIYSAGILLKEMFENNPRYGAVITKALMIDPDDRFSDIAELRNAFLHPLSPKFRGPSFKTFNLPGFRSGRIWKALLACFGYGFIIMEMIFMPFTDSNGTLMTIPHILAIRFIVLALFIAFLDIIFDWFHLYHKIIPSLHSENVWIRAICQALAFMGTFAILAILLHPIFG